MMETHGKEGPSSEISANAETPLSPKFNSLNCVENHLQSLGFVINNGEARFKLDEAAINVGGNTDFSIINAEDPASFVVLGKDSMESIQASCLASYIDIQQKSISVDYNSMISSWDPNEIHQKLTELLQENERLKEALKQNNTVMKQQIGSLASWQEEMMKVHQDHRTKFDETTELIKYLKKENCELKMKLSMDQFDNPETGFNVIEVNAYRDRQDGKCTSAKGVQQKVASFEDDVITSQLKCEELFNEVGKPMTLSDLLNSEIKKTASVHENLHVSSTDLNINQPQIQNWIEYITRLRESKEFFQATKDRCDKITKSLDDAIKILDEKLGKNEMNIDINNYMEVLSGNCKRLQQRSIAVDLQSRLKIILSEYESTLGDFSTHLREQTSEVPGASGTAKATENLGMDEKRLLEEEKLSLTRERESLEDDKKVLSDQKKSLEIEQKKLTDARELLEQKIITLNEEKTSLDQQSQLYENFEKSLQADKKMLETKCDNLTTEAELTRAILTKKDNELEKLEKQIKQQQEVIYSLEVQMKVYEEDFTHERKIKDSLLLDHNKVVADLLTQMEFSKHLQSQITSLKDVPQLLTDQQAAFQPPEVLSIACPICQCVFRDANTLQEHVENCLDLH